MTVPLSSWMMDWRAVSSKFTVLYMLVQDAYARYFSLVPFVPAINAKEGGRVKQSPIHIKPLWTEEEGCSAVEHISWHPTEPRVYGQVRGVIPLSCAYFAADASTRGRTSA
jgi:hypothetical protein